MISTVITTTTTTVAMASSVAGGLDLPATLSLIALMVGKEIAGGYVSAGSAKALPGELEKFSNVGVVPLLFLFGSVIIIKVLTVF